MCLLYLPLSLSQVINVQFETVTQKQNVLNLKQEEQGTHITNVHTDAIDMESLIILENTGSTKS